MDKFSENIKKEIERLEKEMNIAGRLEEIDGKSCAEYDKLKHKYKEIKKIDEELLKAAKKQKLPEIERELKRRKGAVEAEADKIRERIKKLSDERKRILEEL